MFSNCISLKELNVSNFIINEEVSVNEMFLDCSLELLNKVRNQNDKLRDKYFLN